MEYTDTLTKGFLTGGGRYGTPSSARSMMPENRWTDYDDITYQGFFFRINANTVDDPQNFDPDYLPQGLFLGADTTAFSGATTSDNTNPANTESTYEHPDSAVAYLTRRGEYYRAAMIKEFRTGFLNIIDNAPWVFEKLSGMADVWKIDPKSNFRMKEKKITLECNESFNMRLTYLADLYRKGAFDSEYMRWALPETQRYFSISIIVTEIRPMQIGATSPIPFSPANFLEFNFDYCEFDFLSEEIGFLDNLSTYAGDTAKVKIPIKLGRLREVNSYGLLGAVLTDTWATVMRGKEWRGKNFTKNTSVNDGSGDNVQQSEGVLLGYMNTDVTSGIRKRDQEQARFVEENTPPVSLNDLGPLGSLIGGGLSTLSSYAQNLLGAALLGNVYGTSPGSVLNAITGILNNPIAAVQGLLTQYVAPPDLVSGPMGNVSLSSSEISTLEKDAALLAANLGASDTVSATQSLASLDNAGKEIVDNDPTDNKLTLASDNVNFISSTLGKVLLGSGVTLPTTLGKEVLIDNGSKISGNPGTEPLAPAANPVGVPGKETLLDNGASLAGNPGKEQLAPAANPVGNPGTESLNGVGNQLIGNAGKETLLDNGASLAGSPGTEPLAPAANPVGTPGKEQLIGVANNLLGNPGTEQLAPAANPVGNPGTEQLVGVKNDLIGNPGTEQLAPANDPVGDPGKEDLTGVRNKLIGNPGAVKFNDTEQAPIGSKTVQLTGPKSNLEGKPGEEDLTGDKVKLEGNPGTIDLEGPEKTNGIEGGRNVNFTGVKNNLESNNLGNEKLE